MKNQVVFEGVVHNCKYIAGRKDGTSVVDMFVVNKETVTKRDGSTFEASNGQPVKLFGEEAEKVQMLGISIGDVILATGKISQRTSFMKGSRRVTARTPGAKRLTSKFIHASEVEITGHVELDDKDDE